MLLYTGKVSIQEQQQSLKGIYLYYIIRLVKLFSLRATEVMWVILHG